jgi:hypothetical protein
VNTRVTALPSYPSEIQKWTEFLSNFTSGEEGDKYAKTIREIRRRRAKEIVVELDDLQNARSRRLHLRFALFAFCLWRGEV